MGTSYNTEELDTKKYADSFDDYEAFIRPRLEEAYRVLAPNGSLYFQIDYREVHYCKLWLDAIFGRECFINEIIWSYDYGKPKNKWPAKHDNILFYVKDPVNYYFEITDEDLEPYMTTDWSARKKLPARGKLPTDTLWWSIVGTNSKERNG